MTEPEFPLAKPYFKDSQQKLVKEDYDIQDMLGDGGFSVVKRGIKHTDQREVAIKIIKKRKVKRVDVEREVNIWRLASANSDKVVKLYDIYEDSQNVNLIMELMKGGELFEKIVEMDDYSEIYAAKVIKQLFYIIKDLHKIDIVHQDLKPENLLLTSKDSMIIKLCDFGLAEIAEENVELVGIVGSTTYMAPEVVAEAGHGKPVDVYAAGVIMYILLCGYPPFEPENGITELEFPEPEWDEISETAKQLITQLLDRNPDKRPTPEAALKHKWFMDIETVREDKAKLLNNTVRTLRKFKDITPHGTMKEYRGNNQKASLFVLFPEAKDNIGQGSQSKPNSPTTNDSTPQLPKNSEKKDDDKVKTKDPKNKSKDTQSKSKSKNDKERRATVGVSFAPVNQKDSSGKLAPASPPSSKNKNRDHRASTTAAALLHKEGHDFDPMGKLPKKTSEKEQLQMALHSYSKNVDAVIGSERPDKKDKKKENRRSARYDKPMLLDELEQLATKKLRHSSGKKNNSKTMGNSKASPRVSSEQQNVMDAMISFQSELQYQKQLVDFMKQEFEGLKAKLAEEQGKTDQLEKKLMSELDYLKKEADQEKKRRRKMEESLNGSQKTPTVSKSPLNAETPNTTKKEDKKKVK